MKTSHIIISIVFLLNFVSCGKDGPEGPLGPRGEKGEQGIQGAQGIPGTDGNMILHGTGAPKTTHGEIGDFYIDKTSSNLYGPKTTSGWGASTNLKGAKGDTGATGSKGDKGETGAKGDKGATGSKGDKGETGAKGDKGATGSKGDKGETGAKGDKGDKGQDGSQFLSGSAAPTTQGKNGDFYFHTTTATLYGPKAASGWGAGISLKGVKGDKGEDGRTILNGTGNPTSSIGAIGDFYINTTSYTIFGPKNAAGWGAGKSILGDKGDKGAKGDPEYVILSGSSDPLGSLGKMGDFYFNTTSKSFFYRYSQFVPVGVNPWSQIAKFSNTIQFSKTFDLPAAGTNGYVLIDLDLPFAVFTKSMTNVYLRYMNDLWTPLPAYLFNNELVNIVFDKVSDNENQTRLQITRVNGNIVRHNCEVRIVVTEADVFRKISKTIDFRDYNAVNNYFQRSDSEN